MLGDKRVKQGLVFSFVLPRVVDMATSLNNLPRLLLFENYNRYSPRAAGGVSRNATRGSLTSARKPLAQRVVVRQTKYGLNLLEVDHVFTERPRVAITLKGLC